ncbi:MAG: hypothetical protein LC641_06225 [Spirochaeta sp.]|nr:hypothetical protein [Spirochaeta sp.]
MNRKHPWFLYKLLFIVMLGTGFVVLSAGLNACASQTTASDTAGRIPEHIPMQAFYGQGSTEDDARVDLGRKAEATTLTLLLRMEPFLQSRPSNEVMGVTAVAIAEHAAREARVTITTAAAAQVVTYRAFYDIDAYIEVLRQELVLLEGSLLGPELEAFLTARAVEEAHPNARGL